MRYLYLIFLLLLFALILFYNNKSEKGRTEKRDTAMDNSLMLKGRVLSIQTSRNHSFGILLLEIKKLEKGKFLDTALIEGIYPYKIKDNKAELYAPIPDGIQDGDEVIIESNKKNVTYYYVKQNERYEGYIGIVVNPVDIEYVKRHTIFK